MKILENWTFENPQKKITCLDGEFFETLNLAPHSAISGRKFSDLIARNCKPNSKPLQLVTERSYSTPRPVTISIYNFRNYKKSRNYMYNFLTKKVEVFSNFQYYNTFAEATISKEKCISLGICHKNDELRYEKDKLRIVLKK